MSRLLFPGVAACIASITLSSSGVTRNVPVCVRVYDECGGSDLKKMREKNITTYHPQEVEHIEAKVLVCVDVTTSRQ